MVCPTAICAYFAFYPPDGFSWNDYTTSMVAATVVHLPFSVYYHVYCAVNNHGRIDCIGRRLDQTLIHVVSAIFSFSLSGSVLYFYANVVLNSWYIARLWLPGTHDNSFERRSNIKMAVALYSLPMLLRGDIVNCFVALIVFWVPAAACFAFSARMHGWGHTISHILLVTGIRLGGPGVASSWRPGALTIRLAPNFSCYAPPRPSRNGAKRE